MKQIITLLLFTLTSLTTYAQCSAVSIQISSSDTAFVQLYHAGFFLIPSGFDNICEWEVRDFAGTIIHQDTTFGSATEQGTSAFNHSIALTDSMSATLVISNSTEGIICSITDTLYWKETEVLPGSFIGNWEVLNSSGGTEENIIAVETIIDTQSISLFPSPVTSSLTINSHPSIHAFTIFDVNGQFITIQKNVRPQEIVDLSDYPVGVYFIQFWNVDNTSAGLKKILKAK